MQKSGKNHYQTVIELIKPSFDRTVDKICREVTWIKDF